MTVTVEQKLAIHELLARAAYAYDERDVDMLQAGFASDAVLTMRIAEGDIIGPFKGHEDIMKLMTDTMAVQTDVRRHVVSNIFFEHDGEQPVVISNLTLLATENGEARLLATGMYRDELVEQAGAWKIAIRHVQLDSPY
jgi:3-phenylpropionate/cinnamic acid dioxygenase small subunit